MAGSLLPFASPARSAFANPSKTSAAETNVKRFYDTLTDDQKKVICFPFDHDLRNKISANWKITEPTIEEFFNKDQQGACFLDITKGILSPDGYERIKEQMNDDAGGFDQYHVAVFGTPGSGQFEKWGADGPARHPSRRRRQRRQRRVRRPDGLWPRARATARRDFPATSSTTRPRRPTRSSRRWKASKRDAALVSKGKPKESCRAGSRCSSGTFPGLGARRTF